MLASVTHDKHQTSRLHGIPRNPRLSPWPHFEDYNFNGNPNGPVILCYNTTKNREGNA